MVFKKLFVKWKKKRQARKDFKEALAYFDSIGGKCTREQAIHNDLARYVNDGSFFLTIGKRTIGIHPYPMFLIGIYVLGGSLEKYFLSLDEFKQWYLKESL